jgi:hypothetical protein
MTLPKKGVYKQQLTDYSFAVNTSHRLFDGGVDGKKGKIFGVITLTLPYA